MATTYKNLSDYDPNKIPNASEFSFAIAVSDWNDEITHALLKACCETLTKHGVNENNIFISHVPGAFELPKACQWLANHLWNANADNEEELIMADVVICLGCVITGETKHDEYISHAVSEGIMKLNLVYDIPFVFGLLTPRTMEQAKDRAGGKHGNKGVEAAITAIKMADLSLKLFPDEGNGDITPFGNIFPN